MSSATVPAVKGKRLFTKTVIRSEAPRASQMISACVPVHTSFPKFMLYDFMLVA